MREQEAAGNRPEHQPRREGGPDVGERASALLGLDAVGDVRLRDADVSPGNALDDPRDEDPEERRRKR